MDVRVKDVVDLLPKSVWYLAVETDGMREGAWVAEATDHVDLAPWPAGSRLILRKERPHPGAQLRFTDVHGPAEPAVPGLEREPGMARSRADRRRPHRLDQAHRLRRPARRLRIDKTWRWATAIATG